MSNESLEDLIAEEGEAIEVEGKSKQAKYSVKATIETRGVVERSDIIGAIFGQTEGLLGKDLDLRELQENGQIGRIDVEVDSEGGKSRGTISIPSSLDEVKTAIIGASLESIDRVGPCEAKIKVDKIQDIRNAKRKFIVERAKELLKNVERVERVEKRPSRPPKRNKKVKKYKGQPAGPSARKSDAIIIVEGRSDVRNLLKSGIKNSIAIEGTSIPNSICELSKKKTTTALLDGDRGGDLVLKELLQVADINYVARAPRNQSVEDLSKDEIRETLKNKVPVEAAIDYTREKKHEFDMDLQKLKPMMDELRGTLQAKLLNKNMEEIREIAVRELTKELEGAEGVHAVVFDGIVTQKLLDVAEGVNLNYLVGMRERVDTESDTLQVLTPKKLEGK